MHATAAEEGGGKGEWERLPVSAATGEWMGDRGMVASDGRCCWFSVFVLVALVADKEQKVTSLYYYRSVVTAVQT